VTVPAEYSPALPDDGPSDLQRWREDYRRSRTRRSTALAGVSTVVFLTVVGAAIVLSPGWPRVKATFLDWEVAKDSLPDILLGLWLNIRVLAVSAVLIVVVGLGIAALRTLRGPLWFPVRALAAAYTDFFRGMPLIILLYLVGFGLPGCSSGGCRPRRSCWAPSHWCSPTRRTSRRSSGPASSRCTRASGRRPGRSACPTGRPCAGWCCRRRCAG
jgi:His/Glu/Gln/Arg/opine family amino acid ABC transporter permease subunit